MKRTSPYVFPARLTSELHSTLKANAAARQISMHSLAVELLELSFETYPDLCELPVPTQANDKPFSLRLRKTLQASLVLSSKKSLRSLNSEIVGRLLLMTCPSSSALLDAWTLLTVHISTLITSLQPGDRVSADLIAARDAFESKLHHMVIMTNPNEIPAGAVDLSDHRFIAAGN